MCRWGQLRFLALMNSRYDKYGQLSIPMTEEELLALRNSHTAEYWLFIANSHIATAHEAICSACSTIVTRLHTDKCEPICLVLQAFKNECFSEKPRSLRNGSRQKDNASFRGEPQVGMALHNFVIATLSSTTSHCRATPTCRPRVRQGKSLRGTKSPHGQDMPGGAANNFHERETTLARVISQKVKQHAHITHIAPGSYPGELHVSRKPFTHAILIVQ